MTLRYPLRLIYVEWDDAESVTRWMDLEDLDAFIGKVNPIRQAGFLLHEDDHVLILAGQISPEDDYKDEKVGDVMRIPKTWIRVRLTLGRLAKNGTITQRSR